MTKLAMEDFDLGYGKERWVTYGKDRKFIARFKYGSPGACARHYVNSLIELLSVEDLDEGFANAKPGHGPCGDLMKARGYINYNVIKAAKAYGVSPRFLNDNPSYGFDLARKAAA